jgi:hypothetical protein
MVTLFACLLLAASPEILPHKDRQFQEVMELWVIDVTPAKLKNLNTITDSQTADLIRLLGDKRYVVRGLAFRELRAQHPRHFVPLVWGSRHHDKEIAHRCNLLLDAYYVCDYCRGTGIRKVKCEWCRWRSRVRVKGAAEEDVGMATPKTCTFCYNQEWVNEKCFACRHTGNMRYAK